MINVHICVPRFVILLTTITSFCATHHIILVLCSPKWAAPEVLRGEKFGEPCDVYSFAIVLWEVMAWREPYTTLSSQKIMKGVASENMRPEKLDQIPEELWNLLEKMWATDPKSRPTFLELLDEIPLIKEQLKDDPRVSKEGAERVSSPSGTRI